MSAFVKFTVISKMSVIKRILQNRFYLIVFEQFSATRYRAIFFQKIGSRISTQIWGIASWLSKLVNIALGAVESGMATCFLGGMREQEVADELQLDDCLLFLAIALGKPAAASTEKKQSLLAQLESEMLGGDKAVSYAWFADDTLADNYDKSYFQFLATAQNGQVASGTSTSWSDAKLKAIAEGYERQQSSYFFYDVRSSARELSGRWLDPRVIAPLTDAQYV